MVNEIRMCILSTNVHETHRCFVTPRKMELVLRTSRLPAAPPPRRSSGARRCCAAHPCSASAGERQSSDRCMAEA